MKLRTLHILLIPALSFSMLLTTTALYAEQPDQEPLAPITAPSETRALSLLASAHTVAIVDLGEDANFPPADVNGARKFAAELIRWGKYQVVADGQPADVTLRLQGLSRVGYVSATDDTAGYTTYSPYFRLTIIDPSNGAALWDIAAPVISGRAHREDLFQMSVRNLVSSLKTFEGEPLTKQELADVRYMDHQRAKMGWVGAAVIVAMVGGAVGVGVIMKNKFDADVAKGNADQHNFCVVNHIPGC